MSGPRHGLETRWVTTVKSSFTSKLGFMAEAACVPNLVKSVQGRMAELQQDCPQCCLAVGYSVQAANADGAPSRELRFRAVRVFAA